MIEEGSFDKISLDSTAISLGIPRENWDNPIVRRYVNLVNRVENLQMDMLISRTQARPGGSSDLAPNNLAQLRQLLSSPDISLDLSERYEAVELLLRSARAILTLDVEDTGEDSSPRRYIASKTNQAMQKFGYRVEENTQ